MRNERWCSRLDSCVVLDVAAFTKPQTHQTRPTKNDQNPCWISDRWNIDSHPPVAIHADTSGISARRAWYYSTWSRQAHVHIYLVLLCTAGSIGNEITGTNFVSMTTRRLQTNGETSCTDDNQCGIFVCPLSQFRTILMGATLSLL